MRDSEDPLRLVIVDDEPRVTAALERELRQGFPEDRFDILALSDPLDYLASTEEARANDFLVISDLRMPSMNGAEFLENVRKASADVRTVLLTAYSDMDDIGRAVSAGICGLMAKPWDRRGLYGHVEKALAEFGLRRENARLREELARQLATAGDFQRALMSSSRYPGLSVAYRPLESIGCGGDYYDAFVLPDRRSAFIVADVSGHGIKPALVTLILKTIVQGCRFVREGSFSSPAALLAELNDDLCSMLEATPDTLVALAAAFADPLRKSLSVANAGLPAAVLCSGDVVKGLFSQDGPALGFERGRAYEERRASYAPGDRLVLYTDGLTEGVGSGEVAETYKVAALIASMQGGSADAICDAFLAMHPGEAFSDDATVLVASLP